MSQQINPEKLQAAAEHLEWVCQQYPDNEDVQGLYRGLLPLIDDAKAERITQIMDMQDVPSNWAVNADARYDEYKEPSVRSAYVGFQTELEGGLTEEDKQIIAKLEARIKAKAQNHGEQS